MTENKTVEVRLTRNEFDTIIDGLLTAIPHKFHIEDRDKFYKLADKLRRIKENDLLW